MAPSDEQSVHFALFSLSSSFSNSPPQLTTRLLVTSTNQPITAQLHYTDAEGDNVTFSLQSDVTTHGADVTITPDGLLTYTPAPFFTGSDVVVVIMEEEDLNLGFEPNVVTSEVEVFVKERQMQPMLVLELSDDVSTGNTVMTFMGKPSLLFMHVFCQSEHINLLACNVHNCHSSV